MSSFSSTFASNRDTRSSLSAPQSSEWSQIDRWLQTKYRREKIPTFEWTDDSAKALLELMQLNDTQDTHARQALVALRQLSDSYRSEDIKLKENLQILGLQSGLLPALSQQLLSDLTDLAIVLGTSDTSLSSIHQGLSQLHLSTLHYSRQQMMQNVRLNAFEQMQTKAQEGLDRLSDLRRDLKLRRETEGDIEQRTLRRSAELSRIRAEEDKEVLQRMLKTQESHGLDVEAQELTLAQLDSKQTAVEDFQRLLNSQAKLLAAYQEIPPDHMLAKLKLGEANFRLSELTAQQDARLVELADAL